MKFKIFTEKTKQKLGIKGSEADWKPTSNARNLAMIEEVRRFAQQLKLMHASFTELERNISGSMSTIQGVLSSPLPRVHTVTDGGVIPVEGQISLVGHGVSLDVISSAGPELKLRLQQEVLYPLEQWLAAYRSIKARNVKLEEMRLELDSKRRLTAALAKDVEKYRYKNYNANGTVPPAFAPNANYAPSSVPSPDHPMEADASSPFAPPTNNPSYNVGAGALGYPASSASGRNQDLLHSTSSLNATNHLNSISLGQNSISHPITNPISSNSSSSNFSSLSSTTPASSTPAPSVLGIGGGSQGSKLEQAEARYQQEEEKLNRLAHSYMEVEHEVHAALLTLIKDTEVLKQYAGAALLVYERSFRQAYTAFDPNAPILGLNVTGGYAATPQGYRTTGGSTGSSTGGGSSGMPYGTWPNNTGGSNASDMQAPPIWYPDPKKAAAGGGAVMGGSVGGGYGVEHEDDRR